jgi:hypothetical protein
MPLRSIIAAPICLSVVLEDLLASLRADSADLGVLDAKLGGVVEHRMDVQSRSWWFLRELAETIYKLLLQIVGEIVLRAEEDNTAARDFTLVSSVSTRETRYILVMASSRRSSSEFWALMRSSTTLSVGNSRPMIGVTSS